MKAVVAEAVGAGEVMAKTLAYGVDSLFMDIGRFFSILASVVVHIVGFYFSVPIFCFR